MKRFYLGALVALFLVACSNTQTTQGVGTTTEPTNNRDIKEKPVTIGENNTNNANNVAVNNAVDVIVDAPQGTWVPQSGDFVLVDNETGSTWNLRGEAIGGPLKGGRLVQRPAFNAFWFAWSTFYNGSEIWNRDELNQTGDITPTGSCAVPCDEVRLACGGGRDCIPALDFDGESGRPVAQMVKADDPAAAYLGDFDIVLGVVIDGQARAYPHNILWWHEIHNDKVGDKVYSVTFCPLTGSGIVFSGSRDGAEIDFEVSGNLYNSNLVMVDRQTETLWSQMMLTGITGPAAFEPLSIEPVVETTWKRWREMYADTLVTSDAQGYSRNYNSYPYGDYRTNNSDTFRATNPNFTQTYEAKDRVMGVFGREGTNRAYAMVEMGEFGDRVVINDDLDGEPIVVIYEAEHRLVIPFNATVEGQKLTFAGAQVP